MNYLTLYEKAQVKSPEIVQNRANLIRFYQPRYQPVSQATNIPWQIIGCIHSLESSCLMSRHLHNGDPLKARTVHIPKGRPVAPPLIGKAYSWEESAIDALVGRERPKTSGLEVWLEFCERYNGLGYRLRGIPSPYLWSFTDVYEKGLYRSDGVFDAEGKSQNIGIVALLKFLLLTKNDDFVT